MAEEMDLHEPAVSERIEDSPSVPQSSLTACGCGCNRSGDFQLVFALGQLGYDFVNEARRDSITQHMRQPANPHDPQQLLAYLQANPWDSLSITWTLNLDATPVYGIIIEGPFGRETSEFGNSSVSS